MLRTLVLSENAALSGAAANLKLPISVRALHIANTSISGSFGATWMSQQGAEFKCLVAYNTPGLCGQLDLSMPCSMTQLTQGTKLSECQLPESMIAAPATLDFLLLTRAMFCCLGVGLHKLQLWG